MSEKTFDCSACGRDFAHEMAVNECRRCHRSYCDECISEEGLCVPCEEK
jgi:hypothetical protein